ncbi:zinc-dependent peptidase [Hydrogenimonas urashimensis]|uniref:M90 family metallopeptidase n=1 Tax=Hydrogenimonas urashimensis TaxID=2740515 RepID=UPI001915C64D|nr:M90 family metallopeptidase [Hydrogenimonas urashimensis]
MYYIILTQILLLLAALFLTWQAVGYFRRMRLWKRAQKTALPPSYREALEKVAHYRVLPARLKEKIRPRLLFFVWTKEFVGIGTEVTDEMKAIISFYACLMVVNIPDECYDELQTILIYPYDVVKRQIESEGGIYREEDLALEGESAGDTVVIVWNEARREALHIRRHNVILHELAHVLDFENGAADGIPPLERSRYHRWTTVLYRRFNELREKSIKNRNWEDYRLIGEYAATSAAEFFAVITELFFQKPEILKKHFPDLYEELRGFYALNTAELFKSMD